MLSCPGLYESGRGRLMNYVSWEVPFASLSVDDDLIKYIELQLDRRLPGPGEFPSEIHRAMRHAVLSGGKRLRPRLTVMVAQAARATPLTDAEADLVLDAACA